jgi:hypothetical protein
MECSQAFWNTIRDMIRPAPVLDLHFEESQGARYRKPAVSYAMQPGALGNPCVPPIVLTWTTASAPAAPSRFRRIH